jgi:hypothetical protein
VSCTVHRIMWPSQQFIYEWYYVYLYKLLLQSHLFFYLDASVRILPVFVSADWISVLPQTPVLKLQSNSAIKTLKLFSVFSFLLSVYFIILFTLFTSFSVSSSFTSLLYLSPFSQSYILTLDLNIIIIIIYLLLTEILLTPGGSSTVHTYTQTVHRIQRTEHT